MDDVAAPKARTIDTTCCIAGGGPAGMMLGFLLARAGIDVVVLEKHADFLRDFRGDTVHPSTLELMDELGLYEAFLEKPHQKIEQLGAQIGPDVLTLADFRHLPTRAKFIAFMPQWDFLDFLAERGRAFPGFHLMMEAEVTGLIETNGTIEGVRARTPDGAVEVRAPLTVGCDGRSSVVRQAAGMKVEELGAPMDVLWFRVARDGGDNHETFGHAEAGRMLIMLDRGDYWQCAYLIAKGSYDAVRQRGIDWFRQEIAELSPFLGDRVQGIGSWDDVKLLTVKVDRLSRWHRPGLICIGDAAHAMSPIGGVGINLAVQDAVAAANRLAAPLAQGRVNEMDLEAVAERRRFPTRVTQAVQIAIQKRVISGLLKAEGTVRAPWLLRQLLGIPMFRRIPAYLVGIGARPEHVETGLGRP